MQSHIMADNYPLQQKLEKISSTFVQIVVHLDASADVAIPHLKAPTADG